MRDNGGHDSIFLSSLFLFSTLPYALETRNEVWSGRWGGPTASSELDWYNWPMAEADAIVTSRQMERTKLDRRGIEGHRLLISGSGGIVWLQGMGRWWGVSERGIDGRFRRGGSRC